MTQQSARPLTQVRAIWLMTKMRLTRQRNMIANNMFRKFRKKKARDGIAGKQSGLWLLTLVMVVFMSFSFVSISRNMVLNMDCHLVADSACHVVGKSGERHDDIELAAVELHQAPFQPELTRGLTMVVTLLFGIAVLLPLGSKELAQPDWDMEWLVTMPVERATLLWGRLLERSAANFSGMFALLPPLGIVAWYSGMGWFAPLAAMAALLVLLPLAALLHTLADTGLRMWLPASQLRNLQAVTGLFSMPLIYFVMALGMPNASGFVMDWARAFPAWAGWTPPGLVLRAMQAPDLGGALHMIAILLLQTAVLMWGGVALMRYQLRDGVVNSGARESVRRKPAAAGNGAARQGRGPRAWLSGAMSPIKRRELRLLSRDRNFLVQTLLLPVVIVVSQAVFNGKLNSLAELGQHHTTTAAIAFGIGVYVLMLSAFQTLNNEGQVLWLLYTLPRSIESVLKEKAQLWGALTMVYPLVVIGISAWYTTHFEWWMLSLLLTVFVGIPIYSLIAVSLGVFACDPLAVDVRSRVRPTYIYLYMLLAGFYTWSIYSSVWSQKLAVMVLIASMALALWQKARDALPYLLDPAAAPPPRVSTSDGLIAATAFFITQGLATLLIMQGTATPSLPVLTMAFAASGLLVYVLMRFIYWRSKTAGVPVILRDIDVGATVRYGAIAAAVACAAGLAYMVALRHSSLWSEITQHVSASAGPRAWLLALAVLAAPLFEEFIFRGLIYGGLRRSMPMVPAMAMSAAVFAVVHPPMSMLPVFVLGLCTAWTYERSKTLLGPMLVHAVYNAVILSWQFWM